MLHAWASFVSAPHILGILIGVCVGLFVGSLPGLGPVFVLTLLLPISAGLSTVTGMGLLFGGYTAAVYGGAITTVLFGVPGHPGNIATLNDGPQLTRAGRAGEAIVAIGAGGAIAALLTTLVLMFLAPAIATAALHIGPADYFMLAVFGIALVVSVSGRQVVQGLMLGLIGFAMSTVGQFQITAQYRFTFGLSHLEAVGLPFGDIAVGIFGFGVAFKILFLRESTSQPLGTTPKLHASLGKGLRAVIRRPVAVGWATVVGIVAGLVPGLGITLANVGAYEVEVKRQDRRTRRQGRPRRARGGDDETEMLRGRTAAAEPRLGKGNIAGVVVAEVADNATLVAEMIPALSLGLPGAVSSAILLEALQIHGVGIGPLFYSQQPTLRWQLGLMFALAAVGFGVLGMLTAGWIARAARTPAYIVAPAIVVIGSMGAFLAGQGSAWDIGIAMVCGLVGFGILSLNLPLAPLAMGVVLGPLAEQNYDRAVLISHAQGHSAFLAPMPVTLGVLSVLTFLIPLARRLWAVKEERRGDRDKSDGASRSGGAEGAEMVQDTKRMTSI